MIGPGFAAEAVWIDWRRAGGVLAAVGVVCVILSFPAVAIWWGNHRPRRAFQLEDGTTLVCRHLNGNLRYGFDLRDCEDGRNRYGIHQQITVEAP